MFGSSLSHMTGKRIRPRVTVGRVLELGPGGLWPGLELLRANPDLDLVGLGFEEAERKAAVAQARAWGVADRAEYLPQAGLPLGLPDRSVEAVVSFGSLAMWPQPLDLLNELARVLKVEGEYFIGVPRSGLPAWRKWLATGPEALKRAYQQAAMDADRVRRLLSQSQLERGSVETHGPDVWIVRKAH
ncbi:MAG: class I SAM-dependent methyltransferase [candidate division FCPU426 bacterium]